MQSIQTTLRAFGVIAHLCTLCSYVTAPYLAEVFGLKVFGEGMMTKDEEAIVILRNQNTDREESLSNDERMTLIYNSKAAEKEERNRKIGQK